MVVKWSWAEILHYRSGSVYCLLPHLVEPVIFARVKEKSTVAIHVENNVCLYGYLTCQVLIIHGADLFLNEKEWFVTCYSELCENVHGK